MADSRSSLQRAKRRHTPRITQVILSGVEDIPHSTVLSVLKRFHRPLRRGTARVSLVKSSGELKLSHPNATDLLELSIPENLFGDHHDVSIRMAENTVFKLFCPWLPKYLSNSKLLEYIPGAYRITRFTNRSKGFVYLNSRKNQAYLVRDGLMIGNTCLTFEVPYRQKCNRCEFLEHGPCSKQVCFNCGREGHSKEECEHPKSCTFCHGDDHTLKQCDMYEEERIHQHERDTSELLQLIPSSREALDGHTEVKECVDLCVQQKKLLASLNIEADEITTPDSYASIVRRKQVSVKRKRKAKKHKEPISESRKIMKRHMQDKGLPKLKQSMTESQVRALAEATVQKLLPQLIESVMESIMSSLSICPDPLHEEKELEIVENTPPPESAEETAIESYVEPETSSRGAKDTTVFMDVIDLKGKRRLEGNTNSIEQYLTSEKKTKKKQRRTKKPSSTKSVHTSQNRRSSATGRTQC